MSDHNEYHPLDEDNTERQVSETKDQRGWGYVSGSEREADEKDAWNPWDQTQQPKYERRSGSTNYGLDQEWRTSSEVQNRLEREQPQHTDDQDRV